MASSRWRQWTLLCSLRLPTLAINSSAWYNCNSFSHLSAMQQTATLLMIDNNHARPTWRPACTTLCSCSCSWWLVCAGSSIHPSSPNSVTRENAYRTTPYPCPTCLSLSRTSCCPNSKHTYSNNCTTRWRSSRAQSKYSTWCHCGVSRSAWRVGYRISGTGGAVSTCHMILDLLTNRVVD